MPRMDYREGFEALQTGDYRKAVEHLKQAAVRTEYASDIINHAYTLALYRSGEWAQLAEIAFGIANLILESDPASAMDYFQRAMIAGLDATHIREIGEIYETWAGKPSITKVADRTTAQVGHVITHLRADDREARYLKVLVESLKASGIESSVFTTEAQAAWFFNPAKVTLSESGVLGAGTSVVVGSVEGDFMERSERIAQAIRDRGIPLVLYHGDLTDQIATRVAAFRPAVIQVNVAHGCEMDADLFEARIHLTQNGAARSPYTQRPSTWIPPSCEIEQRITSGEFQTRHSIGIAEAGTVSASFAGLPRHSTVFVKVLVEVLRRFPNHFHLFAGGGDVRAVRGLLHSEGVLPRVRFLGQLADATPLFGTLDLYLAPFPDTSGSWVLEAMGAGKSVIAMKYARNSPFNTAAELVGESQLTPNSETEYVAAVDRLLRDNSVRSDWGALLHRRFRQEFRPELLGERYAVFLKKL